MPETTSDEQQLRAHLDELGSARSDFRAALAKKVDELRTSLRALETEPSSPRLRDDLRRRLHALSAGARLLRLSAMASELVSAEKLLERAAVAGSVEAHELRKLHAIVDAVPARAWNEPEDERALAMRGRVSGPSTEKPALPPVVLVVGAAGLADAIMHPTDQQDGGMECERSATVEGALEMTRALAPDVVVVDADLAGASELVEKLARDPLTEPVPVVALGTWAGPEEASRWLAAGCSRALPKPVSPHRLREACLQVRGGPAATAPHMAIGTVTVDELTERVVQEVQRGLRDAVAQGQTTAVRLDDGTDVLAAVWGAVARMRDVVVLKSGGAVRFRAAGPEGGLPIAPWWGENTASSKRGGGSLEGELRLDGRQAVVADDDPGVTWFVGGVLRAAGAIVYEARDGERALELCFRTSPDLVISDVLMPRLDGFALCRALKRDIALRDIPVILLSWKEDLLQRLRDLGADADGYLRKEASAGAILQRVYEVLHPRTRIEARLQGDGEVRGRLDGVTPRSLLDITARLRENARVSLRDASFLYEVEMRDGVPKSATRTTSDGSFERGKEVFASLLGVRAGRFVVTSATGTARGTLQGTLAEQLDAPIAQARAALALLTGTRLLEVHRVEVAVDRVLPYLGATPEPARSWITRLANGASPRALILAGEVAPMQLEDVLADLASHAAILGVHGEGGVDLLGRELEAALAARRAAQLTGDGEAPVHLLVVQRQASLGADQRSPSAPAAPRSTDAGPASRGEPASLIGVAFDLDDDSDIVPGAVAPPNGSTAPSRDAPPERVVAGLVADAASSLEAAVMREISDRTPLPGPLPSAPPPAPSIIDAAALKSRMAPSSLQPPVSSALLPLPATQSSAAQSSGSRSMPSERAMMAQPRTSSLPPDAVVPAEPSEDRVARVAQSATQQAQEAAVKNARRAAALPDVPPSPLDAPAPHRNRRTVTLVATAAATAVLFVVAVYAGREPLTPEAPASGSASPTGVPGASSAAATLDAPRAAPPEKRSPLENPVAVAVAAPSAAPEPAIATVGEDLPLPAGVPMNAGQGMLDIETGGRESIFVDGAELGRGPVLRLMLSPGVHEVRVRARAEERIRFVMVRSSRRTKLSLVSPWAQ